MKIVYLTHQYFPRHLGGTEVYTHALATRARGAGHSVHVLTCVESPHLDAAQHGPHHTEHDGLPVTEIHYNLSIAPEPARAEYDNPFTARFVRQELERIRPDLVHAVHLMKLSGAALPVCYELNIPVVVTLADYWFICPRHTLLRWNQELCDGPRHQLDCLQCLYHTHGFAAGRGRNLPTPLLRRASDVGVHLLGRRAPRLFRDTRAIGARNDYLRRMVGRADRIIALSDFQKEMFVRNGYADAEMTVMTHGLETCALTSSALPSSSEIEIVFIGSLVYHKGLHVLLKAMERRPELPLRLLVYGERSGSNPYLDSIKEMAARDSRVSLMGTFPPEEFGRVLGTAHVLVMPALWYENEPLVVKAARFLGVPVMASKLGTLAASVRDGENGWLVAPGDTEAWASALGKLSLTTLPARNPDASIKSMDTNAREMFQIYEEVLEHRRCPEQSI